ncbi:MAG: four helix bundle protein [Xenococcaceae cyanobacterium]
MASIRSFKELRVWQNAMDVAMKIFELTKSFPIEERYSLTDQMRRSSRSVAANLTEAWRKRRYPAAFVSKLSDAESEAAETQTWIEIARRCGYLSQSEAEHLDSRLEEILAQLVTMASSPEKWTIKSHSPVQKKRP